MQLTSSYYPQHAGHYPCYSACTHGLDISKLFYDNSKVQSPPKRTLNQKPPNAKARIQDTSMLRTSMSTQSPCIVWFRQDLRLQDNAALNKAIKWGGPIVAVYIWEPQLQKPWPPGAASCWWLHTALEDLSAQLNEHGLKLIIQKGPTQAALEAIIQKTKAKAIFWNRCYEPASIKRDTVLKKHFEDQGLQVHSFNSALLHEPHTISNKSGKPFQVFTPYWAHCLNLPKQAVIKVPLKSIQPYTSALKSLAIKDLDLLPHIPWDKGLYKAWQPTRAQAVKQLNFFKQNLLQDYPKQRNFPNHQATSRLSPYLHFGQLGPREVWHALEPKRHTSAGAKFLAEIGWREFAYHLLYHFPHTEHKPLRPEYEGFPWEKDTKQLHAWQRGQTGYPIVDAGMRQLWVTGWMHNRLRMVVGSFLVKHLLQDWQSGSAWFWDTLVDADLANNTLGWQWVGGCGADAAPYFRVFNPLLQSQKFDSDGEYIRQYVPELKNMPTEYIHAPWKAPKEVLEAAGVTLGKTYPKPIVDHAQGRARALGAYEKWKTLR